MIPAPAFTLPCIFLCGAAIGSLLNTGIRAIPVDEGEGLPPRHPYCLGCGRRRAGYEYIPLLGYALQRGRCRACGSRLSAWYPVVEAANGILYLLVYLARGWSWDSLLLWMLSSALLMLGVIDLQTYEIPVALNVFILALGVLKCIGSGKGWSVHVVGMFAVSLFLFLLWFVTGGRAVGGGDVKLMAAAGLFLGWKLIILAFCLGCILGSVLHLLRMRISRAEHVLAFGPYLSMGIFVAALWGENMICAYLGFVFA